MGIEFSELRNSLGNGYRAQVLYGSSSGLKKWKLTLPTLAHTSVLPNTYTDFNGASVGREEYIWSLYCEARVTGQPFAYQCPRTSQYYLVDFADDSLEYSQENMYVKLYSSGVELVQVRLDGETVFDFDAFTNQYGGYNFDETTHGAGVWTSGGSNTTIKLAATGDVVFSANPQNGLNTVRLSGTANTGLLDLVTHPGGVPTGVSTTDALIVMKMREATFSNNAGIIAGILVGDDTTTKFQSSLLSGRYWLNSVEFGDADLQAPMNSWAVIHARFNSAQFLARFGKDGPTAGTNAEVDFAQIILLPTNPSFHWVRDCIEALAVKWGIG